MYNDINKASIPTLSELCWHERESDFITFEHFSSCPVCGSQRHIQEDNAKVAELKVEESQGKGKLGEVLRGATA